MNSSPPDYEEGYLDSLIEPEKKPTGPLSTADFYGYMPEHRYIYSPSGDMWPGSSVNARVPPVKIGVNDKGEDKYIQASAWIDQHRPVEQMTWMPGLPMIVRNKLVKGGWIDHEGATVFNQYREPQCEAGDDSGAQKWIDHIRKIYPTDADHIIRWLAHKVQNPGDKVNHALVLGGAQGVGKDSLLEPVKYAVGPWNFNEVSPQHLLGRFNPFVKSVILRVSEARDLGEVDRFAFYDHMKTYTAAPPDVLMCDEKNIREHPVFNVMGVIITTNHKSNGIYLPADDRRHYVAWSDCERDQFTDGYWLDLYRWYRECGLRNVAEYLRRLDISGFDAKAPPAKTPAFWDIVDASRAPEDGELADLIESMGNPPALTLFSLLIGNTDDAFRDWLKDRRNSRQIPHRLESAGYVPVRNPYAKDGLYKVGSKRQVIYGRKELDLSQRLSAASSICESQRF